MRVKEGQNYLGFTNKDGIDVDFHLNLGGGLNRGKFDDKGAFMLPFLMAFYLAVLSRNPKISDVDFVASGSFNTLRPQEMPSSPHIERNNREDEFLQRFPCFTTHDEAFVGSSIKLFLPPKAAEDERRLARKKISTRKKVSIVTVTDVQDQLLTVMGYGDALLPAVGGGMAAQNLAPPVLPFALTRALGPNASVPGVVRLVHGIIPDEVHQGLLGMHRFMDLIWASRVTQPGRSKAIFHNHNRSKR